jgi:DNA polymerase III subunit delta
MKANKGQIERAFDSPDGTYRLFFLYGPDDASSRALIQRLVRAMGPDSERIDLDGPMLKSDPARLADEASSLSLFGGRRYIISNVTGDEALPAIEGLMSANAVENPVVILAGALKATSGLVKRLLNDPKAACLQSYPPNDSEFAQIAHGLAREQGLRLGSNLDQRLVALCGGDRAVLAREIEKLALYLDASPAHPQEAGVDDVEAIGAANDEPDLSGLTDAVLNGKADAMADHLAALSAEGVEGIAVLRALNKRVHLLIKLSAEMASGKAVDALVAPIFWKERASITAQLRRWSPNRLAIVASRLLEAERGVKSARSVGPLLADAELTTIARAARR